VGATRGASEEVIARSYELGAVERLLSRAAAGPAALVLSGEAGIGKTTLWNAARAEAGARGFRVLSSRPARTEAQLPLGGFGDLFGGVPAELLERLPDPQRRALEVALVRVEPGEELADQRALSVASVALLGALAARQPVLIALDDVQWLDESTGGVLAFAIRRLEGSPVGVLLTLRGTGTVDALGVQAALSPGRIEQYTLSPLSLAALHRLFVSRIGRSFPRLVLLRIEELSGGNPFYALEIGKALERRDREATPGEPLPLPETLAALTAERIAGLPAPTRKALLLAAAAYEPELARLRSAGVREPERTLQPALEEGIVEVARGAVHFAHPLLAHAVLASADEQTLRQIHRRLAEASRSEDACARHLGDAAD